jgi:hypothetical protein
MEFSFDMVRGSGAARLGRFGGTPGSSGPPAAMPPERPRANKDRGPNKQSSIGGGLSDKVGEPDITLKVRSRYVWLSPQRSDPRSSSWLRYRTKSE